MENQQNTTIYDPTDNKLKTTNYVNDKTNYTKFRVRFYNQNDLYLLRSITGLGEANYCKKQNAVVRDKTDLYEWTDDIMPYGNGLAKDVNTHHTVIICKNDLVKKLQEELVEVFKGTISFKKQGHNTMTTQISPPIRPRGIWKSNKNIPEIQPAYPVCILSYRRADSNGKSHLYLTKCKIHHKLFIQEDEYEKYEAWYNKEYCELVKCPNFSREGMGSTPVRNAILKWARDLGHKRVWMLDDNIKYYQRYYQGYKCVIQSAEIFTQIEMYIDNYDNVGAVSHNFSPFICEGDCRACIVKNGKCYSSMLLPTDLGIEFRYKHQEDNLLSIEYVCKGYCNLCFNNVLYSKDTSGVNKGGNHEEIYKCKGNKTDGDGYKERFEYFEMVLKILEIEGKLKLRKGREVSDLMKRSMTMKSKEYHARMDYDALEGRNNEIIRKSKYATRLLKKKSDLYFEIDGAEIFDDNTENIDYLQYLGYV